MKIVNTTVDDLNNQETFMRKVNETKQTLDINSRSCEIHLDVAAKHNVRRKINMIMAIVQLHNYMNGTGGKPTLVASDEFNPCEGPEKTNLHYLFKAMSSVPPWELHKDLLIEPTAVTLAMIEIAVRHFPSQEVFRLKMLTHEFINRWTLPKCRSEWTNAQYEYEMNRYQSDMTDFEKRFKLAYTEMSIYFGSIETAQNDPQKMKIDETHKRVKAIAAKVCTRKPSASFVAQEWAYERWIEFKNNPVTKRRYCTKNHRLSHADCFDYNRRKATELGFSGAKQFEAAIRAAQLRHKA